VETASVNLCATLLKMKQMQGCVRIVFTCTLSSGNYPPLTIRIPPGCASR